jgi:hypothetical protein
MLFYLRYKVSNPTIKSFHFYMGKIVLKDDLAL